MITPDQAAEIRKRNNALMAWVDSIRGKNGWASYRPEDKPADVPDVTNAERSALEVFEFCTNPPEKYFLYINREKQSATTWTGACWDTFRLVASTAITLVENAFQLRSALSMDGRITAPTTSLLGTLPVSARATRVPGEALSWSCRLRADRCCSHCVAAIQHQVARM